MFTAVYKCRLCGTVFNGESTLCRDTAFRSVLGVAMNGNFYPDRCNVGSHRYALHLCEGGSYGLADFQGFRKEEWNGDRVDF